MGHLGHRGAADLDTRVAPRGQAALRRALPHPSHAEAGDERDLAVDHEALAVVAPDPPQRLVQARRVVAPDVHAALAQAAPEAGGGLAQGAEPVVDDPDRDPLPRLLQERGGEALPRVVVVDDVVLEVDGAPRLSDRGQPRGVVLRGVAQEAHGVPAHQGRSRGPREDLVAEPADRLRVGHDGGMYKAARSMSSGRGSPPRSLHARLGVAGFAWWHTSCHVSGCGHLNRASPGSLVQPNGRLPERNMNSAKRIYANDEWRNEAKQTSSLR